VNRAARSGLALLFAACAAGVGFLEGGALADGRFAPKGWFEGRHARTAPHANAPAQAQPPASLRELFAALPDLEVPPADVDRKVPWLGLLAELAGLSKAHGFATDLADEARTVQRCKELGAPAEVAAFLDLWSEVAARADNTIVRDTATRIAARLDDEPLRARLRVALLAGDHDSIRTMGVDADPAELDARSAALLGAALWRAGVTDDALAQWRAGVLEHPDDPVLHLLLAWALGASDDPDEVAEARRHVACAAALLPESESLRRRVATSR
jgi:hypothetical protein